MQKLLTIAIPTYNRAKFLDRLLKSIFDQYDSRIEVLVSDNASSDTTDDIVKKYSNITYLKNSTNIGPDANFMQCYHKSSGKYVWLVGSDDVVYENCLPDLLSFLESNQNLTHIFVNHNFFKNDEDYKKNDNFYLKQKNNVITKNKNKWLKEINAQITFMSAMIIKRNIITKVLNYEDYYDSWFMHVCVELETVDEDSLFAIYKKCCLSDDITPANANQDKKENWIFLVFGEKLNFVFCDLAIRKGFNNRLCHKIYRNRVCGSFARGIIRMKARDVEWKKEFYTYAFPYLKLYLKTWLYIMPAILLPKPICKFINVHIKKVYKKIIRR